MTWFDLITSLFRRRKPAPPGPLSPLMDEINRTRATYGSPPLIESTKATLAAGMQSLGQARRDRIGHDGAAGLEEVGDRLEFYGQPWSGCGEIVAQDYSFRGAVSAWVRSPGHNSILLGKSWTHAGAAVANASEGRIYATVVFFN